MEETQVSDNYTSWFNDNYGITGNGEEPASLFDMSYLYPVSDPESPSQEVDYQVQHGRQSENDCRYWLSEYDSCCGGGYWGDNFFAGRYNRDDHHDDGCNDPMVKTDDSNQSEYQYRSYTSYCEDEFSQPHWDYNPWSNHQYCEDEDSYSYNGDETSTTYGYRMDEVGFCEGIFGHFPCLLREQREHNSMQ